MNAAPANATVTSTDDLLRALDGLLPELRDRAAEGERERTMSADLVAQVEATGLFRMQRVRGLGGLEVDPVTCVDVVERLAHADASAAWSILIGATANAFFGWLDPTEARTMLDGCADAASSCVFAPGGQAVDDGAGGFTVRGRWAWNSGVGHAAWHQLAVVVSDADGPVITPAGVPDVRVAFVPAGDARVVDTWQTMGLRGTGSNDVVLNGVTVPAARMFAFGAPNRHDGDYARLSVFSLVQLGVVGFPLGIARRALDEFTELARTKMRGLGARWAVAEDGLVQADLGRVEGELAAARAYADAAVGRLWDAVREPGEAPLERRADLSRATSHAMRTAVGVVDTVFRHAGGSAVFTDHPLQRCLRDVHTVAQHVFFSPDTDKRLARLRLGFDEPTMMI